MLSVDVNLAPQSLDVDRDGDAMPFAGCHVTEIKTGGANRIGSADIKLGVSRAGHPLGGDDVDQASLLSGRPHGIVDIHDGSPVVDQVTLTVGVLRQGRQQALPRCELGNLDDVGHLAADGRDPQRLGGSECHQVTGVLHVFHVRTSSGGKIATVEVPQTHVSVLRQKGGLRQQRKQHCSYKGSNNRLFFHGGNCFKYPANANHGANGTSGY